MLEESVIYQDILQQDKQRGLSKGEQRGLQKGLQQGLQAMLQQQLARCFGQVPSAVRQQIERLTVAQLEEFGIALLEFQTRQDVYAWFERQTSNEKGCEPRKEKRWANKFRAVLEVTPEYVPIDLPQDTILAESVVYQDVYHKGGSGGWQKGFRQGLLQGKQIAILCQLEGRFGKVSRRVWQKIEPLAVEQVDALLEALSDFQSKKDLRRWLRQHVVGVDGRR